MDFDEYEELVFVFLLVICMAMSFVSLIFVLPTLFVAAYLMTDSKDDDTPDEDTEDSPKTL